MNKSTEKVLYLTLKKKWFDMILSGQKKEEYREIKPFWKTRFEKKQYDVIVFINGYAKNAPRFKIQLKNIGKGLSSHPEWGGDTKNYQYILNLGSVIK